MKLRNGIFLCFILIAFINCRKPYQPAIVSVNHNYLVVEGVINSGSDSTFIKLSHTVKLDSKTYVPD
ncbi:MAG: hypothetical protein ACHQHN_09605, partial [Sphingobacteriales bacterium]